MASGSSDMAEQVTRRARWGSTTRKPHGAQGTAQVEAVHSDGTQTSELEVVGDGELAEHGGPRLRDDGGADRSRAGQFQYGRCLADVGNPAQRGSQELSGARAFLAGHQRRCGQLLGTDRMRATDPLMRRRYHHNQLVVCDGAAA